VDISASCGPVGTVDRECCADGPLRAQKCFETSSATDNLERSPLRVLARLHFWGYRLPKMIQYRLNQEI
jgi:hypothetical protein